MTLMCQNCYAAESSGRTSENFNFTYNSIRGYSDELIVFFNYLFSVLQFNHKFKRQIVILIQ